ncbi:MAG: MATE family efflux transporter [Lachnospiraceae bacterium]|nr:MATE family efflux transporter [Lachnospiraceae bacterium]
MKRRFLKYVIPSIFAMWIYSLYTMVDGIFVSHGVGEAALAAVNLAMPYVWLVFASGILLAAGISTMISTALGSGHTDRANQLFSMNFAVAAGAGLLITALTLIFLNPLTRLLGATPDSFVYVREYVGTVGCFAVFFIVSYNMELLVKTDGSPMTSTVSVLACGLTNVLLDYLFVMRLSMGVFGAALATGLAQVASTLVFTIYFRFFSKRLRLVPFRLDLHVYPYVARLGSAAALTELSGGIVVFLYNHVILSVIGENALVSYTVISYLNTLVLSTMGGVAQGMQPLVSYHYGAGEIKKSRQYLRYALEMTFALSAVFFAVCELAPGRITGLFLSMTDGGTYQYTIYAIKMYAFAFLFLGTGSVTAAYFTSVLQPGRSLILSMLRALILPLIVLPLSAYFSGEKGIWFSAAVSEGITAALALIMLCRQASFQRPGKS